MTLEEARDLLTDRINKELPTKEQIVGEAMVAFFYSVAKSLERIAAAGDDIVEAARSR